MTIIQKTLAATANATAKGFSAFASVEIVDRDGDVVVAQGMNSRNYERNPVLLCIHEDKKLPVGKCTSIRRKTGSIEMDFALTPKPDGWAGPWEPDAVGAGVSFGSLNGVSIRFSALPGGVRTATAGDIAKYGDGCQRVYSKWELLEVSVVSLPANQDALIYAVQKAANLKPSPSPQPKPVRHVIDVRVPMLGSEQVKGIASREISRAMGRLYWRDIM